MEKTEAALTEKREIMNPGHHSIYYSSAQRHFPTYLRSVGEATSGYLAPGWRVA